jgi:hypothetical protein
MKNNSLKIDSKEYAVKNNSKEYCIDIRFKKKQEEKKGTL